MIAIIKNVYTNEVVEKIAVTEEEKHFWNWLEKNGYIREDFQLFMVNKDLIGLALKNPLTN